ncbi:hypothetical protein Mic7113_0170 [Allocoleopsis franciscana PCC 7113]|uniref:Uncharacterized protein n=1 Tax=Allocoleopsis franciscana PCC 7113 TaxID=1173027 RepID=K9W9F4_9CYAN|nr:hypothetical protein Mic7113_0170 [Allocoleopsis franciscana PCC 7113]
MSLLGIKTFKKQSCLKFSQILHTYSLLFKYKPLDTETLSPRWEREGIFFGN